jgi:hypothetical protein
MGFYVENLLILQIAIKQNYQMNFKGWHYLPVKGPFVN